MYLEKFIVRNFRSISSIELSFKKGLNIIIGENNAGKSSIIDALRICLSFGRQYREIGINKEEDFYIDTSQITDTVQPIHFTLKFKIESTEDTDYFTSLIYQDPDNVNLQHLQMDFVYELEENQTGNKTLRWRSYGAGLPGQQINPDEAQLIYYTYLAPLRDAEQELKPYARQNKITSLFQELSKYEVKNQDGQISNKTLDSDEKKLLAGKIEEVINGHEWTGLLLTGEKLINEHLLKADISKRESKIQLRLLEYKYENIVKAISTKRAVYGEQLLVNGNENKQRYFEVSQNGLGENNLIYSSAVLGDLKNRRTEKKEHYYALFIEEPEAHLHPQRQNTFFNYLNNLQGLDIQLFITSHSPTITAKSDLNSLIVLQHQSNTHIPFILRNSELTDPNKKYLRKFLDVTKSQLFFSNGSLLVEGISEALLLPILARIINTSYDLEKNGIEIVNISGVAFESFAKLYNSSDASKRMSSRCAIISDNDKGMLDARNFVDINQNIDLELAKRIKNKLMDLNIIDSASRIVNFSADDEIQFAELGVDPTFVKEILSARVDKHSPRAVNAASYEHANLRVRLAEYTFEYEMMIASEVNYVKMMTVYRQLHPDTVFLENNASLSQRAFEFLRKLDSNKDKSNFAENFALFLEEGENKDGFVVPTYITEAVKWVLKVE